MDIKPKQPQRILARFLMKENSNEGSPLYHMVSKHLSDDIYNQLYDIQYGRKYDSVYTESLNLFVDLLNIKTDGYIKNNWKDI